MRVTDIKVIDILITSISIKISTTINSMEEKELRSIIDLGSRKTFCKIYTGMPRVMVVGKTVVLAHQIVQENNIQTRNLTGPGIFTIESSMILLKVKMSIFYCE